MVESTGQSNAPLTDIRDIQAQIAAKPNNPVILIFGGMGTGKSTFVSNLTGIQGRISDQALSVTSSLALHSTDSIHAIDIPGAEDSTT